MRQYAGYGSAEETNARFRFLLDRGQTGLSVAFDLPTQLGYDSDDPLAAGEVGGQGSRSTRSPTWRLLLDGIPLDEVSTSMTINAPAALLLLLYELVAEEQGVGGDEAARNGPERRAQGVHRARQLHLSAAALDAPDDRSLRVLRRAAPEVEHDLDLRVPHPGGGASAAQELAFTLANGIAYCEAAIAAGLSPDEFGERLSFFFNAHNHFFQEVAKFRAARRLWAQIMRDRFGATNSRARRSGFTRRPAARR